MAASLAAALGGYLGQAITQDGVTRGVSYMVARHQERASMGDSYEERIKLAHSQLQFVLERSGKLPITDVSLLRQRIFIKRAFQECDTLLLRSLQQPVHAHSLLCDNQQAQQEAIAAAAPPETETAAATATEAVVAVTAREAVAAVRAAAGEVLVEGAEFLCSSVLPVVNTVRSFSSALGITRDKQSCLRIDDVKKFEGYADFAGKFMRDVESGCSIAHYRFFSPLITQLLQGFTLRYKMVQASRARHLWIRPVRTEEHGVIAWLTFRSFDAQIPTKCFEVVLFIRLSENTDIVGIVIPCLESLGGQFKSLAQVAMGELSQFPTQDLSVFHLSDIAYPQLISRLNGTSVQQMGEMVLTNAITCFIRQPELTKYRLDWVSLHGAAGFSVEKPSAEVQRRDLLMKRIRLRFLSEDV